MIEESPLNDQYEEILTSFRLPIKEHRQGNHTYRAGKCAEMSDGSFLRIKSMSRNLQRDICLKGDHLTRATSESSMLPPRQNELVWLSSLDSPTTIRETLVERRLVDAVRIRKINFTNERWEILNTRTHANAFPNARDDNDLGELFCRYRYIQLASNNQAGVENIIRILTADEADERYRVDQDYLRCDWRGSAIVPGGSFCMDQKVFTLDGHNETVRVQKYTLLDAFCGGGGITQGACMAGLHPAVGFDFDKDAINTYRANFQSKGTLCLLESVDEFIRRVSLLDAQERRHYVVDILHVSPVCKTFSPAYTRPNEETGPANEATVFSVQQLLETLQPRIVTVEETYGLLHDRHVAFLSALVNIFVSVGYSVRWKVCNFAEYGVPQQRRRLLFIAAAPGERLPPFPQPTHGEGLKKLVTIQDTLMKIPEFATRQEESELGGCPKPALSADSLAKTITCNGGQKNYHPSGTRAYTIREMASLQTFPWYYRFPGKCVVPARQQIGNAVSPLMAKALFQEILKSLKETDGIEAASKGRHVDTTRLD